MTVEEQIIAWLKHHERTGGEQLRFHARQFREGIERGDHIIKKRR